MLEQQIERRVIDAVKALQIEGLFVDGAWQTAAEGELKGEESPSLLAVLSVAVGQRCFETFGCCKTEFPVSLGLVVPVMHDPRGEIVSDVYSRVTDLLTVWHFDENRALSTALSVPGFHADGIRLDGGVPPQRAGELNNLRTVTIGFTIIGTLEH